MYSKVNQLYTYKYALCFRFFSHIVYRILSKIPCAIEQVVINSFKYQSVQLLSHVRLFATSWKHRSPGSSVSGNFPSKNTGVGCHFLLQGIFLTQGLNLLLFHLLHWQADSSSLSHLGGPLSILDFNKKFT